jgi:hypothetical protein
MSSDKNCDAKNTEKKVVGEKSVPIFRIKPINKSNGAIIKFVGSISENEKLGDEILELDKPIHPDYRIVGKHALPIKKINSFELVGRLYRCNIVGTHIVMSSRYPVIYLNVHYDKPMVSGSLFQLFLSIDIDKNQKREIKNNKQYVNLEFNGKYVIHLDCDDEFRANYEKILLEKLEKEAILHVASISGLTDAEITEEINKYIANERVFYDDLMKNKFVDFKSLSASRDDFIELCTSEKFYKFLEMAMKGRELHRRKEYGIDDDSGYVVPTNITKMNDIKQQLLDNGELILDNE